MLTRNIIKKTAETLMYGRFPYGLMRHVPQGFEFYFDLKKYRHDYSPKVVFDVGANTGQTVIKWNKFFPKAQYYCFEPVAATMSVLKRNTYKLKNIQYFQCALGAETIESEIILCEDSSLNSLVATFKELAAETETVQIKKLDEVCYSAKLDYIDILKIDTEGFDIEVLKGSASMLKANSIGFIQVEAGMNPTNKLHVPLQAFVDFLAPYGYVLFGIYEQHLEWTGENRLAFSNPVFISERQALGR
jgi:FkbM family methyltransferase